MALRRTRTPAQVATGLSAIGVVTAVGLAGVVPPAAADTAHLPGHRPMEHTGPMPLRSVPMKPATERTHTVRTGDTVSALALRYDTTISAIVKANRLNSRAVIYVGQVLTIPGPSTASSSSSSSSSSGSPSASTSAATYTVRSGDTLSGIAAKHGTSVAAIMKLNSLSSTVIYPGQRLKVSGASSSSNASTSTSTPPSNSTSTSSDTRYTVRSGDTVSAIAAKYDVSVAAIVSANGLNSRALIRIGQVLTIPSSGSGGSSSSSTSSSSSSSSSGSSSSSSSASSATSSHTVRTGETLSAIAAKYGTSVAAITSVNNLSSTVIYPGQVLKIQTQLVPNSFLHYTYPDETVAAANQNKHELLAQNVPSRTEMQNIIRTTAQQMGVDPALALAVAQQESGFDHTSVSPANAIGAMQVIPSSGEWASSMVGRDLDLLDPHDNAVAGVAILRYLVRTAPDLPTAIAGYYQGLRSVTNNGMFSDTRRYVANIQTLMTRYA